MRAIAIAGLVVAIAVLQPGVGVLCVTVFMAVSRRRIAARIRGGR